MRRETYKLRDLVYLILEVLWYIEMCPFVPLFLDHVSSCGGARGGSSGVIQSPNYPSHYPNNRTCVWPIIVEYGRQVQLRFRDFILQSRVNTDYVAVYDGDSQNSDMLGKYYAQGMAPKVLESSSNQMFVVFHSDGAHTYRGFHATYQIKGRLLCLTHWLLGDALKSCDIWF